MIGSEHVTVPRKKVAIIGTGIAGNVAAYLLRDDHDITVYEAGHYVGGHTNTVDVWDATSNLDIPVDTGFIVFNDRTYPEFSRILDELGQAWQPSVMSFSVQSEQAGVEYNGASLNALFAQRRNILSPPFYRMVRDILRFNKDADGALQHTTADTTLGEYLAGNGYSNEFVDMYLVPMAAAIWSSRPGRISDMPLHFLLRFFRNHGLLQLKDRPRWRVIKGGSREYVKKLVAAHSDRIRLSSPVTRIERDFDGVTIHSATSEAERYDAVFIACHSDQGLEMLRDPTLTERQVLGAIRYQENEAVLHTDVSLLPKRRRCWAAWNYHVPEDRSQHVAVTYNMNMLQGISSKQTYCVTLNDAQRIAPERVIRRIAYQHPIFDSDTVSAQRRQAELNSGSTFFCGAYWRNGFHEDGVVSAIDAVRHFEESLQYAQLHIRRAG